MVKSNLAAWTPAENNPPYISINYIDSNGTVELTVRERTIGKDLLGCCASVKLTQEEFQDILNQLKKNINQKSDNVLLGAVKAAYLKHHLNSDTIGWDELSDILLNALCAALGDKGYQDWYATVKR
jgi:hypothetical protein